MQKKLCKKKIIYIKIFFVTFLSADDTVWDSRLDASWLLK